MDQRQRPSGGRDRDLLQHRALAGASRLRILRALRETESPLDADELAALVGLHRNTVRSHLSVLERGGLVERAPAPRDTPGRPRIVYRPAPEQDSGYLTLSRILAERLAGSRRQVSEAMVEAGRAWGHAAVDDAAGAVSEDPVEGVVELLDEVGFEPEVRAGPSRGSTDVLLHACPFRAVAKEHPEIVCSVHLGLIRGALERLGAGVEASGLEPFVRPDLCIAHLSPSEATVHV